MTFQHARALNAGSGLHKDPLHNVKTSSTTGQTLPQASVVSKVPLKVTARFLEYQIFSTIDCSKITAYPAPVQCLCSCLNCVYTFCNGTSSFQLQIKVSGQRGSLGLSIAGGKGSLPYKNHEEVSAEQRSRHLSALSTWRCEAPAATPDGNTFITDLVLLMCLCPFRGFLFQESLKVGHQKRLGSMLETDC